MSTSISSNGYSAPSYSPPPPLPPPADYVERAVAQAPAQVLCYGYDAPTHRYADQHLSVPSHPTAAAAAAAAYYRSQCEQQQQPYSQPQQEVYSMIATPHRTRGEFGLD